MKDKILILIIGMLIGAIIASVAFLIYNKTTANNSDQINMMQMNGDGQFQNGNMGEPPAKPDGDNGEQPPTKPDDNTNTNS